MHLSVIVVIYFKIDCQNSKIIQTDIVLQLVLIQATKPILLRNTFCHINLSIISEPSVRFKTVDCAVCDEGRRW